MTGQCRWCDRPTRAGYDECTSHGGRRLWAHIQSVDTRWHKIHSALSEFAWRGRDPMVDDESKNPIKRFAGWLGYRMLDAQTRRINRRVDLENRGAG